MSYSVNTNSDIINLFSAKQLIAIENLPLPPMLIFKTAAEFDDKHIVTKGESWEYMFSGRRHKVKFTGTASEIKLKKYLLASYVIKNSPYTLYECNFFLSKLFNSSYDLGGLSYKNATHLINVNDEVRGFYITLFFIKHLCRVNFPEFPENNLEDIEFIPRPKNYAWLSYQDIDSVLSTHDKNMITRGMQEIATRIKSNKSQVSSDEIEDCSILGLCYTVGLRPVQLAKLSIKDFHIDSTRAVDNFKRYSILLPYAKQSRLTIEKVLISIPPELAEILVEYQIRSNKKKDDQFFDTGNVAVAFVNNAINRQMLRFAPADIQKAVDDNLMIAPTYSSFDFRHNVGHSLAMQGASAEEIAYILGHSSLVVAKHYIMATPELALVRAQALGTNPVWQNMIAMMLTGPIVSKNDWSGKKVIGIVDGNIHAEIGGCNRSYPDCPFSEVRSCYGCLYYHPFPEGDHIAVLSSVKNELLDLIDLSDSVGYSSNPLIQVHESTKFEVESVIARCKLHGGGIAPLITQE